MEKHYEKKKNDAELMRNVIFNAIVNANRKKNTRVIPLFVEEQSEKTTEEIMKDREELFGNNPIA